MCDVVEYYKVMKLLMCFSRYSMSSWWLREREGDYMPIVSLDDKSFVDYIQHTGLHNSVNKIPNKYKQNALYILYTCNTYARCS